MSVGANTAICDGSLRNTERKPEREERKTKRRTFETRRQEKESEIEQPTDGLVLIERNVRQISEISSKNTMRIRSTLLDSQFVDDVGKNDRRTFT